MPPPLPLPLPLPISSLMTVDSTISHSLEICAGAARESHSSPCRRHRRFRSVPSVSAGRRLHFSRRGRERRTRSIRNEGHQFNVADAFSGKELERERGRCRRDGRELITFERYTKKIVGKTGLAADRAMASYFSTTTTTTTAVSLR